LVKINGNFIKYLLAKSYYHRINKLINWSNIDEANGFISDDFKSLLISPMLKEIVFM
jgi:hypothetical protein